MFPNLKVAANFRTIHPQYVFISFTSLAFLTWSWSKTLCNWCAHLHPPAPKHHHRRPQQRGVHAKIQTKLLNQNIINPKYECKNSSTSVGNDINSDFFNKVDLSHIFLMFNINILYHLFLSHFKTCLKTSAACAYEKKKIS